MCFAHRSLTAFFTIRKPFSRRTVSLTRGSMYFYPFVRFRNTNNRFAVENNDRRQTVSAEKRDRSTPAGHSIYPAFKYTIVDGEGGGDHHHWCFQKTPLGVPYDRYWMAVCDIFNLYGSKQFKNKREECWHSFDSQQSFWILLDYPSETKFNPVKSF